MWFYQKCTWISQLGFIIFYKDVHQQVSIFNDTLMNIVTSFVPNKSVTIDHKDVPWVTEVIKQKTEQKIIL